MPLQITSSMNGFIFNFTSYEMEDLFFPNYKNVYFFSYVALIKNKITFPLANRLGITTAQLHGQANYVTYALWEKACIWAPNHSQRDLQSA